MRVGLKRDWIANPVDTDQIAAPVTNAAFIYMY